MTLSSPEQVTDVLLGLIEKVPVSILSSTETRFGMKKALRSFRDEQATISIRPSPADMCTITVRGDSMSPPVAFNAKLLYPPVPNLPKKFVKVLFDAGFFFIEMWRHQWSIQMRSDPGLQTPSSWLSYWRLMRVIASGVGTIEISPHKMPGTMVLPVDAAEDTSGVERACTWIRMCECTMEVLMFAGVVDEPTVTCKTLHRNVRSILTVHRLMHPELGNTPVVGVTECEESQGSVELAVEMLYINFFEIGDVTLGYFGVAAATGERSGNRIHWKAGNIRLIRVAQLRHLPQDYERMIEAAKRDTGCPNFWARKYERSARE
jgi:hypothetical protein